MLYKFSMTTQYLTFKTHLIYCGDSVLVENENVDNFGYKVKNQLTESV